VRSKSFTEQDVLPTSSDKEHTQEDREKYHTVGTRDGSKFQGFREKLVQWNSDLKKRMSTENLSLQCAVAGNNFKVKDGDENSMFVTAVPQQGQVKSAVVVSYHTSSSSRSRQESLPPWSSPSPSPPISDISNDSTPDHRRSDSYRLHPALFQDQDSGYDGYCPEQSIYSTTSSDSSSVISSEADISLPVPSTLHRRALTRPRPAPIYEKDGGSRDPSLCRYRAAPLQSRIAQATVINLVKSQASGDTSVPPPLPPRPSSHSTSMSLPPLHNPKPSSAMIRQGAISLPRKRPDSQDTSTADTCRQKPRQENTQEQKIKVIYLFM
jgi:hypothetical protein